MTRSETLRSLFEASGKGLEIGPSHNPLMSKAAGFNVEVLDYLDASALRRKYANAGVDVSAVEEVDYVGDGRPMTEVIGDRQRYDWIVASHVIEHVPDFVAFLVDCEALLKPGGSLVLAVPDKRCCFEFFVPFRQWAKSCKPTSIAGGGRGRARSSTTSLMPGSGPAARAGVLAIRNHSSKFGPSRKPGKSSRTRAIAIATSMCIVGFSFPPHFG